MLKIAVIDSGAGGLSILSEVLRRQLDCNTVYVADLEKHPYGTLEEYDLKSRVLRLVETLIAKESPDLCVIACNTASTIVLPSLRQRCPIPFVGVVPAVKPAVAQSFSKCIGVLATPGTIARRYLDELIEEFAKEAQVFRYGSKRLVRLAEDYVQTGDVDNAIVNEEIDRLTEQNESMDVVVLACTHFPLLKKSLDTRPENGRKIKFIDSTNAIVNRIEQLLPDIKQTAGNSENHCRIMNTRRTELTSYAQFLVKAEETSSERINFEFAHLAV